MMNRSTMFEIMAKKSEEAIGPIPTKTIEEMTRMTAAEWDQHEANRMQWFLRQLEWYRQAGAWENYVSHSLLQPVVMEEAFKHFDEVPDNLKVDWTIRAYSHNGDHMESVRQAIYALPKYAKPNIPRQYQGKKTITVYRAGEEDIEEAADRISWTTDKRIAFWFYRLYDKRHANHVWKAEIRPEDAIWYRTDEAEILQYQKVQSIKDITKQANSFQAYMLAYDYEEELRGDREVIFHGAGEPENAS